jgi:hypothetical protein
MHRFWRATIAFVVSAVFGFVCSIVAVWVAESYFPGFYMRYLILGGFAFSAIASAAIATGTSSYIRFRSHDRETRCRKCGYILRGISELRYPEGGERI